MLLLRRKADLNPVRGQGSEVGGGVKLVLVSVIMSGDGARFFSAMGKNSAAGPRVQLLDEETDHEVHPAAWMRRIYL